MLRHPVQNPRGKRDSASSFHVSTVVITGATVVVMAITSKPTTNEISLFPEHAATPRIATIITVTIAVDLLSNVETSTVERAVLASSTPTAQTPHRGRQ